MFKVHYNLIRVGDLNRFDEGSTVDAEALCRAGLLKDIEGLVKILGDGELQKKLTVLANKFSASATQKITDAGGQAQTV